MVANLQWLRCAANNPVHALRLVADRLIGLSAIIGSVGLLFEVAIILIDVIGRALGKPLLGSQDYITMAMVILVFGGMAACDRRGGHIAVDLLERRIPPRLNRIIDVISALLGALAFAVIAYAVYESSKLSQMLNLSTNLIKLPKVYFQWALCGFTMITSLGMILRAAELALSGRDVTREAQPGLIP
jgi:TRAP-type C4-dicarboxylate transport system permease small subunit